MFRNVLLLMGECLVLKTRYVLRTEIAYISENRRFLEGNLPFAENLGLTNSAVRLSGIGGDQGFLEFIRAEMR